MTIFHHVFSRLALLFVALWGGGGLILLTYCVFRWERRATAPGTHAIAHLAEMLFVPNGGKLQGWVAAPGPDNFVRPSRLLVRQAEIPAYTLRSASLIKPDHPSEPGLVSVVIPSYNRERILGRAIESALGQTYTNVQVVVADDGSSDDTRTVAESYGARVTYVHQQNAGVAAARNLGLRHARGEFIAFLDSDDEWRPWKIDAELAAMRRHPEAGIVWTDMESVDENGRLIHARHLRVMYGAYAKVDIEKTLRQVDTLGGLMTSGIPEDLALAAVREGDLYGPILLGNLLHTSTVLFRRAWFEKTGGSDESSRSGEDYEFYIRLCSAGPVLFIDAPSTISRVGAPDQLTRPSMMLEIARNNLRAVQKWAPSPARQRALSPRMLRRRIAESFAWVGEAEFDAGHRWSAARRLTKSLAVMPRLDRRAVLLVSCAVPDWALQRLRVVRHSIRASTSGRPARGLLT
jgi:GT2 family glycosyltransferase